ncbi:hypothetical protein HHI36_023984 [Cryptolaemus montrouzieri]|uniref:Angiotensin-converting enzyme n=1 Tax=Cryptolaemus montrouzieri TaxID=559131 RepID=A0ABD2NP06_9CUCU
MHRLSYRETLLILVGFVIKHLGALSESNVEIAQYRYEIEKWLNEIDADFLKFNSLASHLTWEITVDPEDRKHSEQGIELTLLKNRWRNSICEEKIKTEWLTEEQSRKIFLLCRGGKYKDEEILKYVQTMGELSRIYSEKICLPHITDFEKSYNNIFSGVSTDVPKPGDCVLGEPDLENLMKNRNLNAEQLKFIWRLWHDSIGPKIKTSFLSVVHLQNEAARRNGYRDNGEIWREELEMPHLERLVEELYSEIEPLYKMIHSVIRHKLHGKYGSSEIDLKGPIPVHLLGNMWGQDWSYLMDLLGFEDIKAKLSNKLKYRNVTMRHLVSQAEDFYVSMGMRKMTTKFWKYSLFEKSDNLTICHGTAANLFDNGDFRIMMCGEPNMDDFYVIHHEMGHIEYYMAYEQEPAIFQDGTNTAFHESIGDAIMHGVMVPQHLHRIGLLSDEELFDNNTEFNLILLQALEKIPEIPFALLIDKYRWKIFRGDLPLEDLNRIYWKMNRDIRGIIPPETRDEHFFDAGAKFHIPDGTPYIRYFLSGIIQIDLFKSLCEYTFLGRNSLNSDEENILPYNDVTYMDLKRLENILAVSCLLERVFIGVEH